MKPCFGKTYELHFGKDIFVKYKVKEIFFSTDKLEVKLEKVDKDYMGADEIVNLDYNKLVNKRKIRKW